MNKKIIIFSFALAFLLQPAALLADTNYNLLDKEQLIQKAKELEEKSAQQDKRILQLEHYAQKLEQNQQDCLRDWWCRGQGAFYATTFVAFLALYRALTRNKR